MANQENGFGGWQLGGRFLGVLSHSETNGKTKDPGRLIINYETAQVKEEFERVKSLGGTVVHEPDEMGNGFIATLSDPDCNYFQPMSPMA